MTTPLPTNIYPGEPDLSGILNLHAATVNAVISTAAAAYVKPGGGIPQADLNAAVQTILATAVSAYQKPGGGIPAADMASAVQSSLTLAGSSVQPAAMTTAITTAVNNLIASAPGALDTLNELASALGDDPNFATTVTNALAVRIPLWQPTTAYTVGQVVAAPTGDVVKCATAHTSGSSFSMTNWSLGSMGSNAYEALGTAASAVSTQHASDVSLFSPLSADWTNGVAGAVARSLQLRTSDTVSVKDFGVKGDGRVLAGAITTTAGSAVVTDSLGEFTSADAILGRAIAIPGAGTAGANLLGTVLSYQSATQVTLTANAPTTVTTAAGATGAAAVNVGTDDYTAIMAAANALSAAGGAELFFPASRYFTSKAIRCQSKIRYRGAGHGTIIYNSSTNTELDNQSAFLPGVSHPSALYQSNPSSNVLPTFAIADLTECADTVVGSSAGVITASSIAVGSNVGVRSNASVDTGNTEVPDILYWTKVTAKSGDTLTLADPTPAAITGATLILIDGTKIANGSTDIPLYMAENFSIENMSIDARCPVSLGCAYNFVMRDVHNAAGRPYMASFVSCNGFTHALIEHCRGNFSYTWLELKHGSSDVEVRACWAKWMSGASMYDPMSFGEGSRGIHVHHNRVWVGTGFSNSSAEFLNFGDCDGVEVDHNSFKMLGTIDSMVGIYGGTTAANVASNIRIHDNDMTTAVTVNRVLKLGSGTAAFSPSKIRYTDNTHVGAIATSDWCTVNQGLLYLIKDNLSPTAMGSIAVTTNSLGKGAVEGNINDSGSVTALYYGREQYMAGWLTTVNTTRTLGNLPLRGAVTCVRVEVNVAFNATTTNTLVVGFPGTTSAYVTSIPVGTIGVFYIYPGSTNAGTLLGTREATAARTPVATYAGTGTAATAGRVMVTAYYEENLPSPL